jgi:hypothetical protein
VGNVLLRLRERWPGRPARRLRLAPPGASVGVGASVHVLLGRLNMSIPLQPLSLKETRAPTLQPALGLSTCIPPNICKINSQTHRRALIVASRQTAQKNCFHRLSRIREGKHLPS